MTPAFSASTSFYSVTVDKDVTQIGVGAVLGNTSAKFVDGYGPRTVNLNPGVNSIVIKVRSEAGTLNVYTVNVSRGTEEAGQTCDLAEDKMPLLKEIYYLGTEIEDANIYMQLSRRLQGKPGMILRKMAEQEQAHAACLKGIYTLLTGKRPAVAGTPNTQQDPAKLLRLCYGREMRCLARYEQRSDDPEYGPVFSRLAEQEREHCRLVLEILGEIK